MKTPKSKEASELVEYSPGMRVVIRDEEWMVKKVERNNLDKQSLHCVGVSPLVKDRSAIFLTDLEEIIPVNPAEIKLVPDDSQYFKRSRLYIESQWRQQIPTDTGLHIGNQAAMDPMNYQLEPAQMALRRPKQRILIADTVGLGKTLEAGILMSELIARGKGKRILVVTVKSMMMQFQKEMWNRFTIPLIRLDSKKIQDIRAKLPSNYNPFFYYDKTIVSIDTLKRDVEYRTHLENATWDIIVIDEAHNVAERGGHQAQRARLAKLLAGRSDTLIMLSATPHDGRSESFASLMNMLDPTAIADIHNYTKEDIRGLCIRRFKKDIKSEAHGAFQERSVSIEHCSASDAEERAFRVFADMTLEMDAGANHIKGTLFKTSLEKSLFSSPAACIKSLDERLRKLVKKYGENGFSDIAKLRELRDALLQIDAASFSRYTKLLQLLRSPEYGWNADNDDRIVIFTERIETMHFVAAQLRKDLHMTDSSVREMYGGLSDEEQQRIVDEFGRVESPIRVLVASDVASEGINLHYLSHRLIHFDIPWSLMVFQQRNGRVDRYGQTKKPDIRYLMIESKNDRIKGDVRIMEILVIKEEQAYKNIGDPALLMGKFNIEEEEQVTAAAIESGLSAEAFDAQIDDSADDFDPFEALMAMEDDEVEQPEVHLDETLYRDIDYLRSAMSYFAKDQRYPVRDMQSVDGIEIEITPDLKRRLDAVLPDEVKPEDEYLRLSPDKEFCMSEMKRSMRVSLADAAWPTTQYLWKLHPIFDWVNDKAGLLFKRGEAPLSGIYGSLARNELIYIVSGIIPNRKSTPVVDEWFGLHFINGTFSGVLTMEELITKSRYGRNDAPNRNLLNEDDIGMAEALLPCVIAEAQKVMSQKSAEYRTRISPQIDEELDKLIELEGRHKEVIQQLSLFESVKSRRERETEELFNRLSDWVKDTLEIEDKPYLRVIAVLKGV